MTFGMIIFQPKKKKKEDKVLCLKNSPTYFLSIKTVSLEYTSHLTFHAKYMKIEKNSSFPQSILDTVL